MQARPETIHSKAESNKMTIYKIDEIFADSLKRRSATTGQAVGKRMVLAKLGISNLW